MAPECFEKRPRIIRLMFKVASSDFEQERASSPTEQRRLSQVMRAVAHGGALTAVAGFNRQGDPFPDLAADSTFYCEPLDNGTAARTID